MTLTELQNLDFRCYVTAAGFNYEATAKATSKTVNITHIQLGNGMLPADQSPVTVTELVESYGEQGRFSASVTEDADNPGGFIAQAIIPADHAIDGQGYVINEAAAVLDNGIVYAYRRVESDYKLVGQGSAKSYILRMRFRPANAEVIHFTIDPSVVLATEQDLNDAIKRHEQKADPHSQYAHKTELSSLASKSQFLPYNPDRKYRTGEVCYTVENGELSYWQWYSNVESLAGKSPLLDENRHTGWTDSTKPFYWVPYTGDQVGQPFFWLDTAAPEWAVMEINVDLPVAVYWRLARRYPHLVSGDTINTGEIRGEFLRVLDQGRGVDENRYVNEFQKGTHITGDNRHAP
ncbi:phage tail protein, partial [Salinivibrio sp. VYel6]|uniref:phage tail protein n=1 Tax=Salinivibrio sp. VYel6 TaxID=2490493 RepID=UPI00128D9659